MTSPFAQRFDSRHAISLAVFCLLGLLVSAPATAEPSRPLDLRWEAPPGCPQEGDVRNRIQKILGPGRHDSPLRAEGSVTRTDSRFRLELVVHMGETTGTRSLAAKSCEDLAGAAAVEIGLLLHSVEGDGKLSPGAAEGKTAAPASGREATGTASSTRTDAFSSRGTNQESAPERVPEQTKAEPEKEVRKEADESAPQTKTPRLWRVLAQVPTVAVGLGPLPGLSLGFGLSLGIEYERWQFQLEGLTWQGQNVSATGLPGYGADVDRMGARLLACREIHFAWLGLSPCLAGGMDRVSASGTGANVSPVQEHAVGVAAGAGIQARLRLTSWIRLLASVVGEIELLRPQLSVNRLGLLAPPPDGDPADAPTVIYDFAPAALTATLSLEWVL